MATETTQTLLRKLEFAFYPWVCGTEQTTGHLSPEARQLEIPHAQSFPSDSIRAAETVNRVSFMIHAQSNAYNPSLDRCSGDSPRVLARAAAAFGATTPQDRAFIALQNAYRAHGGLSRLSRLNARGGFGCEWLGGDVEDLFAAGDLFGFEWNGAIWIPLFQFGSPGPTVAPGPQRVVAELGREFDGWALASWFVEPNAWLANRSPIESLASDLPDVLEAARADRFVVTG